jgi:hypothetical protein
VWFLMLMNDLIIILWSYYQLYECVNSGDSCVVARLKYSSWWHLIRALFVDLGNQLTFCLPERISGRMWDPKCNISGVGVVSSASCDVYRFGVVILIVFKLLHWFMFLVLVHFGLSSVKCILDFIEYEAIFSLLRQFLRCFA